MMSDPSEGFFDDSIDERGETTRTGPSGEFDLAVQSLTLEIEKAFRERSCKRFEYCQTRLPLIPVGVGFFEDLGE